MNKFQFLKGLSGRRWMYNRGAIALVGDWLAYKSSGTGATLTKNADNLSLVLNLATGWAYGQSAIDLTNINTLYFYGNSSGAATMYFGAGTSYTSATNAAQVAITSSNTLLSLDVSALSGNHYVRFGRFGSNASTTITCYEIYGE